MRQTIYAGPRERQWRGTPSDARLRSLCAASANRQPIQPRAAPTAAPSRTRAPANAASRPPQPTIPATTGQEPRRNGHIHRPSISVAVARDHCVLDDTQHFAGAVAELLHRESGSTPRPAEQILDPELTAHPLLASCETATPAAPPMPESMPREPCRPSRASVLQPDRSAVAVAKAGDGVMPARPMAVLAR